MPEINYFWDESEDNVVEEYDENGNTTASYTTEPTLYGAVLSQDRNDDERYFHFDGEGNTTELTDDSGNVTDQLRYSALGVTTIRTGVTQLSLSFGGRSGIRQHYEGTQYDARGRTMDSLTGRWLTTAESETARPIRYSTYAVITSKRDALFVTALLVPVAQISQEIVLNGKTGCSKCGTFDISNKIAVRGASSGSSRDLGAYLVQRIGFKKSYTKCTGCAECLPDEQTTRTGMCWFWEILASVRISGRGATIHDQDKDGWIKDDWSQELNEDGKCVSKGSVTWASEVFLVEATAELDNLYDRNAGVQKECGDFKVSVNSGPDEFLDVGPHVIAKSKKMRAKGDWNCCPTPATGSCTVVVREWPNMGSPPKE